MPSLGSSAAGYNAYSATENLPDWFRTALMTAADNTPASNPTTDAGAELGRVLFYDQRLSHNDSTSCASCHVQENGFSDPDQFSVGFDGGLTGRHSMGLSNARFYGPGSFFWDQRAATLEDQVLGPIQDAVEMGSNLPDLLVELRATEFYPVLFERAFGPTDPGEEVITEERLSRALSQFVRSMVSYQSKFDQALAAEAQPGGSLGDVLTAQELSGHRLFGASCGRCHLGDAQIASSAPRNIGLDITEDENGNPIAGVDQGAGDGRFKVPSLRNIAVRDGFMHDGRFTTLEEVIDFYSEGVLNDPNLDFVLQIRLAGAEQGGFDFSQAEKDALIAFLETLTDDEFLTSDLFSDPFVTLAGDFDGDGVVDNDDFDAFAADFGSTDGDGTIISAASYAAFRDSVGARWDDNQQGATTAAVSAPEPAAAAMLASWLALGWRRRKR